MNGKGPGRPLRGTNSLLWALFKPSSRTVRRWDGEEQQSRMQQQCKEEAT